MIKHPSIEQFKSVIRNVKHKAQFVGMGEDDLPIMNRYAELPVLTFQGTVKLHGTNSSIVFGDDVSFQSRNRILKEGSDNAGFLNYMTNTVGYQALSELEMQIISRLASNTHTEIVVYGEWCGEGIQKGVAISQVPKMFVIFGVKLVHGEDHLWLEPEAWKNIELPEYKIFNIQQFPIFEIEIDFARPALVSNELGEMTKAVEDECPVGKQLGASGIGEGIVWKCVHPDFQSSSYWFKVKGEKHSVSKVKTLAPVDVEKLKTVDDFMDSVVTENRLLQGIEYLNEMGKPLEMGSTGDFLSWMFKDIMKEEADTMEASEITRKDIGKPLGERARKWYFKKLEGLECQS